MMLKLKRDGGYTTYVCNHLTLTEIHPGSEVAKRDGNSVGTQLELSGVTSVTFENETQGGRQVTTESRAAETVYLHLPTDGPEAYQMDNNRNTIGVIRPRVETTAERRAS